MIKKISRLIGFLNKNKLYAESRFLSEFSKYAMAELNNASEMTAEDIYGLAHWQLAQIIDRHSFKQMEESAAKALYSEAKRYGFDKDPVKMWPMSILQKQVGADIEVEHEVNVDLEMDSDEDEEEIEELRQENEEFRSQFEGKMGEEQLEKLQTLLKHEEEEIRNSGFELADQALVMGHTIKEIFGLSRSIKEMFE